MLQLFNLFSLRGDGGSKYHEKRYDNSTFLVDLIFPHGVHKMSTLTGFHFFDDVAVVFGGFSNEFISVNWGESCDKWYKRTHCNFHVRVS